LGYWRFDGHFTGERPNDHRHGWAIGALVAILQENDPMTIAMVVLSAL
jgi:hypothetical protein